jgi:hypothetical protein
MGSATSRSKHNQAVPHRDDISCDPRSGAATTKRDCEYVKLPQETILPDGTKMTFYARKDNAPTFDEIMDEIYELVCDSLVRKLHE